MNIFSCSPALPSFIILLKYLISFQSSVYIVNTTLFSSVEAEVKYLFPLLSSLHPSLLPIIRYSGFTLLIF